MKEFQILLRRCRQITGKRFESAAAVALCFFAAEYIITSAAPGIILSELLGLKRMGIMACLACAYAVCIVLSRYFYAAMSKQAFEFRVREITNIEKMALRVPASEIEQGSGKNAVYEAMDAVCSGNDYGIESYLLSVAEICTVTVTAIVYIILLRSMPVWLLLLYLACAAMQFLISSNFKERDAAAMEKNYAERHRMEDFRRVMLQENFAKDVRLYNCIEFMAMKLERLTESVTEAISGREKVRSRAAFARICLDLIVNIASIGIILAHMEQLTAGQVTLYIGFLVALEGLAEQLLDLVSNVRINRTPTKNYISFIDRYSEKTTECNTEKKDCVRLQLADGENIVVFKNLTFGYDERILLSNLNASFSVGEKIAVIGENGAGKSTLMKLLTGTLSPTDGEILLAGKPLGEYSEDGILSYFSIAEQNSDLPAFTIVENMTGDVADHADEKRVTQIIGETGLKNVIDKLPDGLETYCGNEYSEKGVCFSGGEKQKLIMARTLYKDAPILLLDEPTAALDARAEKEIYQMYREIAEGKLVFFVSHRLGSTSFCDRILFIEDSKHITLDTFDVLYDTNAKFRRMYDEQRKYYREERA